MRGGPGQTASELPQLSGERTRLARLVPWLPAVPLLASLFWLVHPWYDPTNDGSMYIATARSLLAGEGYRYLGIPFLIRPPGFSCLIAPVLWLRGTDFFALNLLVSLFGALGAILFHVHLRERLGPVLSWFLAAALWLNPGYQRLCNQVMSDIPGWTCLLLCLLLDRRLSRRPWLPGQFALGAAVGLATYVRSGDLLLLPALIAARAVQPFLCRGPRESTRRALAGIGLLLAGALVVLLPWTARNRSQAPEPPADQTLLYSYSTGMWHRDMGDPRSPRLPLAEILGRFPRQSAKIADTLGARLHDEERGSRALALVLVGALVVAGLRRRAAEEFFALGTLLVVSFYFGYAGRLLLPVFALALAALCECVRDGLRPWIGARPANALAAAGILAWIALDWGPRESWPGIERLHRAYRELAQTVRARLPADARLGAYRGWHHAVYLEQPVYSFERAIERAGRPSAAEEVIDRYGLDLVLLSPLGLPDPVQRGERAFAAYLAGRYGTPTSGLVRVR